MLNPLSKARTEAASSWILVRFVTPDPHKGNSPVDFLNQKKKKKKTSPKQKERTKTENKGSHLSKSQPNINNWVGVGMSLS